MRRVTLLGLLGLALAGCSGSGSAPTPSASATTGGALVSPAPDLTSAPIGTAVSGSGPSGPSGGPGPGTQPSPSATPATAPSPSKTPEPPIRAGLVHMPGYHQSLNVHNPLSFSSDSVVRGLNLYRQHCAICHGEDLKGPPSTGKYRANLRDLARQDILKYGKTDQALYRTIKYGIPRTAMGSYEKVFADRQIWDLINFLRSKYVKESQ